MIVPKRGGGAFAKNANFLFGFFAVGKKWESSVTFPVPNQGVAGAQQRTFPLHTSNDDVTIL